MATTYRHLQLRRNEAILDNYAAAYAKLTNATVIANATDGELVLARYKKADNTITTMLGIVHKNDTENGVTIIDSTKIISDLDARFQNLDATIGIADSSAASGVTIEGDEYSYAGNSKDIVNIVKNIAKIAKENDITAVTVNGEAATIENGVLTIEIDDLDMKDYTPITYPQELIDSGAENIATGDTMASAFKKVETAVSALTQEVLNDEEVTMNAVAEICEAAGIGFDSGETGVVIEYNTAYNQNAKYISGATSLANADILLDAAIKQVDNKIAQITGSTTAITSEISNLRQVVGVANSGDTTINNYVEGTRYISGDTTVIEALTTLDTVLTPSEHTDAEITSAAGTNIHNNIIRVHGGNIEAFADLHYDATTNKLTFVNTNGYNEIQLTGVNLISGASYDSATEQINIYYQKPGETSASTISIPVKDIIEEYAFQPDANNNVASADSHNVALTSYRDTSGATKVYGDITVFDCGTY